MLVSPAAAVAATVYATPAGGGSGASCSDGTSLRSAISGAGAGDTVQLCAGTFLAPSGGLSITANNLTVEGEGPATTIVDGTGVANGNSIFGVLLNANFRKLTVRNHTRDDGSGAGIEAYGGGLVTASDSVFSNLKVTGSGSGGAIYSGKAVIATSTFAGNSAMNSGGAVFTSSSATDSLTVSGSTFSGNEARGSSARGGAVYSAGGVEASDASFLSNAVVLEGETGHYLEGGGAGIWADGAAQLERSAVDGNSTTAMRNEIGGTAARGGGIYANSIDLVESTLSDNSIVVEQPVRPPPPDPPEYSCWTNTSTALGGGAFFVSTLTANKSRIEKNLAKTIGADYAEPWGGGVASTSGASSAAFVETTFSRNSAVVTSPGCIGSNAQGGAMRLGQSVTLTRSTVSGNTSPTYGGGMWVQSMDPALPTSVVARNSTFSGNQASSASVIFAIGEEGTPSDIALQNVTVAGNTATGAGGKALIANRGRLQITNTIVADENGCDWDTGVSPAMGDGGNVISDPSGSCDAFGTAPLGNKGTAAELELGPLADNGGATSTMALSAGSAAIGAAVASQCPPTDQRGVARPAATCDSGAYQYVAPPPGPGPAPGPEPGPGPGPGPEPSPSNRFTLAAPRTTGSTITVTARLSGPGRVTMVARRTAMAAAMSVVCRSSRAATAAARVRLTCRANGQTRARQRRGPVRLRIAVTFLPIGGSARTRTRSAVLEQIRPAFTG